MIWMGTASLRVCVRQGRRDRGGQLASRGTHFAQCQSIDRDTLRTVLDGATRYIRLDRTGGSSLTFFSGHERKRPEENPLFVHVLVLLEILLAGVSDVLAGKIRMDGTRCIPSH